MKAKIRQSDNLDDYRKSFWGHCGVFSKLHGRYERDDRSKKVETTVDMKIVDLIEQYSSIV